jgi:hypothetical protein
MLKNAIVIFVSLVVSAGAARSETWRLAPELIHDWSLFNCPHSLPDRFWYFTLEGSRLKAVGPEGAMFTATVAENGSFKTNFTGSYTKAGTDRTDYPSIEVTGNLKAKWVHFHATPADCWYRLLPK